MYTRLVPAEHRDRDEDGNFLHMVFLNFLYFFSLSVFLAEVLSQKTARQRSSGICTNDSSIQDQFPLSLIKIEEFFPSLP